MTARGVLISACLLWGSLAWAGDPVPLTGLYPSGDGQEIQLLVPDSWQLKGSLQRPQIQQANGHVQHGAVYVYVDTQGREHQVHVVYCEGGE
jgi:hypothetical protein